MRHRCRSRTPALARGLTLALTLSVFPSGDSQAEVSLGLKAGSLGVGPEISVPLGQRLNFRGGLFVYDLDVDYTASGVAYEGNIQLQNVLVLVDWHPSGGSFRLSAGLAWNDNSIEGEASLDDLVGLENPFDPLISLGTFRGETKVDPVAPYLGFGWGKAGHSASSGWGFSADIGVLLHGKPEVELSIADSPILVLLPELRPFVELLLEVEELELEQEIDSYQYFPVVSLGVSYRF
ncbi:MAG: hypothetical protein K0U98_19735 [Deltaproteobacteria bacterium]|nr:hypothetical protein [Deltaproteobacteria bacterium]